MSSIVFYIFQTYFQSVEFSAVNISQIRKWRIKKDGAANLDLPTEAGTSHQELLTHIRHNFTEYWTDVSETLA